MLLPIGRGDGRLKLEDKKMKRLVTLLLALAMVFSLVACGTTTGTTETQAAAAEDSSVDFKIGIITGTATQGDEEISAAMKMKEKYGDMIVTATYPDNFSSETEQTIATATNMAADPAVKAIVWVQAIDGTVAAINKIKETRDDMLFIGGIATEAPAIVAETLDIAMMNDEITLGFDIIDQAVKQGAKTFVHISFERHLGITTIAQRQANFKQRCEELGVKYVEATAPDPTGDAGVPGAQAWITNNIKVLVDEYGKDTAFFSTNCSMQVPLIQQCAELGAIYPLQCCPSPFHGYPSAFNIDMEGHDGDVDYLLGQITEKVAEYGNSGRMSTWTVPVAMMIIEAGVEYAIKWCKGEITEKFDEDAMLAELQKIGGEEVRWSSYVDSNAGELKNFKMIIAPFYDF